MLALNIGAMISPKALEAIIETLPILIWEEERIPDPRMRRGEKALLKRAIEYVEEYETPLHEIPFIILRDEKWRVEYILRQYYWRHEHMSPEWDYLEDWEAF